MHAYILMHAGIPTHTHTHTHTHTWDEFIEALTGLTAVDKNH